MTDKAPRISAVQEIATLHLIPLYLLRVHPLSRSPEVALPYPENVFSLAHLPEDRGVWPLWPHRARVHLGGNRQGRRPGRTSWVEGSSQVTQQHLRNTKGPFARRVPFRRIAVSGWPVATVRIAVSLRFPSLPIAGSSCCDHPSCGSKQLIPFELGHLRGWLSHGLGRVPRQVEFDESAQSGSTIFDSLLHDRGCSHSGTNDAASRIHCPQVDGTKRERLNRFSRTKQLSFRSDQGLP